MSEKIQGKGVSRQDRYYQGATKYPNKLADVKPNEPLLSFKNYDDNGKLISVDYYKDFNGDGSITSNELYRVDKYDRAQDGSYKVHTYIDENNDAKVDRTKTYNYDAKGQKIGVTKGPDAKGTINHIADGISDGSDLIPVTDPKNDKRETISDTYMSLMNGKLDTGKFIFKAVKQESDGSTTYKCVQNRNEDGTLNNYDYFNLYVNIKKNSDGTTTILNTDMLLDNMRATDSKYSKSVVVDSKTGKMLYYEDLKTEERYEPEFGGYRLYDKNAGRTLNREG